MFNWINDMRKMEALAVLGVIGVLIGLPVAVYAYQGYREAQEGPGFAYRGPSIFVPRGDAADGRQVYLSKCAACHGPVGDGSVAGPDIRNMSVGAQFVYTWILDPGSVTTIATMPRVPMTEREVADVTAYVMGLRDGRDFAEIGATAQEAAPLPAPGHSGDKSVSPPAAVSGAGDAAKGKTVFAGKGCAACHGPGGEGTAAAPAVKGFPSDKVKDQVRSPKGKMPPFGPAQVSDSELEDLKAFIATLK